MFELGISQGPTFFLNVWGHAHNDAHWYTQKSYGI